jgi:hypothetical protein
VSDAYKAPFPVRGRIEKVTIDLHPERSIGRALISVGSA